jgi:hypothetical protein
MVFKRGVPKVAEQLSGIGINIMKPNPVGLSA